MSVAQQFQRRSEGVRRLGLGLSVDVYSPDLFHLMSRFQEGASRPAYLEIFRAATTALKAARQYLAGMPLAYHGEGLWITQPDFSTAPFFEHELNEVASQLKILASPWLNHECATKQMAGYSFGTYLPPLYTVESANIVADNISLVQERLDRSRDGGEFGPLFLLEMPPLTYFMAGTIDVPEYFRRVTEQTPCGLVLDIGHLWTVYRYSAARKEISLERFVAEFLDQFPMERIIEIHLAGLALHEEGRRAPAQDLFPEWIDAHAAPIPTISWTILEQVLAHPRLRNLRAVALEVDTKPVDLIVEEFTHASALVGPTVQRLLDKRTTASDLRSQPQAFDGRTHPTDADWRKLEADYVRYAQIASGQQPPMGAQWKNVAEDPAGLERYVHVYLPYEILHWGGELTDMFPETCRSLSHQELSLDEFVRWWFCISRSADRPYDFFLLKIDRLLEWVAERAPALLPVARQEAEILRHAYEDANAARPLMESCQ